MMASEESSVEIGQFTTSGENSNDTPMEDGARGLWADKTPGSLEDSAGVRCFVTFN